MREIICGLYIVLYTWMTAPLRHRPTKKMDEQTIKEGHAKNYKLAQRLCRGILKLTGAKLHIQGEENLPYEGRAVYMGTHKSYMDIVIMIRIIDKPLIFIGKSEVDKLPFIRTWFKAIGGIYMDREDIRQSFKVILEAIGEIKKGYSVAIFPEGTRAKGKEMIDFKAGSFKLATKANVPIVPIAMQDTFKLLEEKRRVKPANIGVNVGKAIDVPNLTREKKQTISQDTQEYMQMLLNKVSRNKG